MGLHNLNGCAKMMMTADVLKTMRGGSPVSRAAAGARKVEVNRIGAVETRLEEPDQAKSRGKRMQPRKTPTTKWSSLSLGGFFVP